MRPPCIVPNDSALSASLPPPPPNDRGIDSTVPAAARERAGRHEGGCGAERQMAPARCLCPPEPFVLNLGMAKYILQYLAQSRVSLHLHDSLPTCISVLAYRNHISTPLYFSGDTHKEINHFSASHISPASVHSLHVRPLICQSPYPPLPSDCRALYVSISDSPPPSIAIILVWPHRITNISIILRYSRRFAHE